MVAQPSAVHDRSEPSSGPILGNRPRRAHPAALLAQTRAPSGERLPILHLLGIDHTRLIYRFQGRDFRLTDVHGRVVQPILA